MHSGEKKMCDIRSERARLGGDWAVCSILLTRKIREVVRWVLIFLQLMWDRDELGEELHVICLDMELKDQIARWAVLFPLYRWLTWVRCVHVVK